MLVLRGRCMCLACDMPPELKMLLVMLVISDRGKEGKHS
jgi:hypothetical protein